MPHHISEGISLIGLMVTALLAIDNFRLRRRARVEQLAREVEQALGQPRIGDIDMPDPNDPRWTETEADFDANGKIKVKVTGYALGQIFVRKRPLSTYVGAGEPLAGGEDYAKRVDTAFKRRLVREAAGTP